MSDTARWTAVYRARESERPDAVFRDRLARRLAGEWGERIATAVPFMEQNAWAFLGRTVLFDQMIADEIGRGADLVVNLAAGLDTRPYRMELPRGLRWVEVDLPGILDYKEELLRGERAGCELERIRLDLTDGGARRELFERLGGGSRRALVLSEGLTVYFAPEEVAALARDLAQPASFATWVTDLASPGLLRLMRAQMGEQAAAAPFLFAPAEGPGFFLAQGWKAVEVATPLRAAARLGRVKSWRMRFFAMLPQSFPRGGARPWSGVCRLERMMGAGGRGEAKTGAAKS